MLRSSNGGDRDTLRGSGSENSMHFNLNTTKIRNPMDDEI